MLKLLGWETATSQAGCELHFLLCNLAWVQLLFLGSIQALFVVPPVASRHLVTEVQPGVARMNMTCGSLDNFE